MEKVSRNPNGISLIFVDLVMPHLDGISATAAIKEVALWMPIIAISSNIRADNIDMYFRCGVDAAPYLKRSH